ncbi:response regulator [Adhaeribacter aquaticus]|uniref:response regulator n=1 Tax=Adhaeribacter aquaticus TaxID=299567 RepID=UPI000423C0D2|nr:response regulator [Adhaeribacter aquaticus]
MSIFKTILLIDDDVISNFITEKLIIREGFGRRVITYQNAEDALDFLNQCLKANEPFPDLIFLDLNMPGMDGWEFLEEYRKFPEGTINACRLFMLSSAVDAKDIVHAKSLNEVEDFISKPLTTEDMVIIRERNFNE